MPAKRAEVVDAVRQIEKWQKRAKAIGSVWSLSRAPDSDGFVVDTRRLNRYLSQPFPAPAIPLGAKRPDGTPRFAPGCNAQLVNVLTRPGLPAAGRSLVHVEAGIKIRDLIADLATVGLALPTMGAGGGQSLAGLLATGSHGSDFDLPPPSAMVRAVHLIGPGGREWWIESSGGAGRPTDYARLAGWRLETTVIRDSDFLESVVVGIGRFGVIFSLVIEVVPQYRLEEQRDPMRWSTARARLLDAVADGYTTPGHVFNDPLDPCSGLAQELENMQRGGKIKEFDPGNRSWESHKATPQEIAAKQTQLDDCRAAHSGPVFPLRFWNLVIDANNGEDAWRVRRWKTVNPTDVGLQRPPDPFGLLCTNRTLASSIVITATVTVVTFLHGLAGAASAEYAFIPVVGPYFATKNAAPFLGLAADLMDAAFNFTTLGDWIATVIDKVRSWSQDEPDLAGHDVKEKIDGLLGDVWSGILQGDQGDPPTRRGPSHSILDTHNYQLDGCLHVDSTEYFFDAAAPGFVHFVDAVLGEASEVGPVMGIVGLRFVRRTNNTLGMQRYDRTVAVEVAPQRPGSINEEFMGKVHTLARSHGGIPHWGQENQVDRAAVEQIYGNALEPWRWAVAETEGSGPHTFSSAYTRERGLEPMHTLATYRTRRYVAALTSGLW
jgi:hypothetical protein